MSQNSYTQLAERLDALPNGFPSTEDGAELRLLAKIFTPEEAELAANLRLVTETAEEIIEKLNKEGKCVLTIEELQNQLKSMARKGLIQVEKNQKGLSFGILPFVVGIYELQINRMDAELARLFEDYYQRAFQRTLAVQPAFHRVLPVNESIRVDMEVHPYESASHIVSQAQAWGVLDCICRRQKALIGDPCNHPVDICMILSQRPGAFDRNPVIRALTSEEAQDTLIKAARAGLVHSVSNNQEGISYICNCCTCSCGILRGMAELGVANVVARSAFVNHIDQGQCAGCEICIEACQFGALSMDDGYAVLDQTRCVGCGVCVSACPDHALSLVRREATDILPVPKTIMEWGTQRAVSRNLDLRKLL